MHMSICIRNEVVRLAFCIKHNYFYVSETGDQ
jgi:hypothetical protein